MLLFAVMTLNVIQVEGQYAEIKEHTQVPIHE